MFQKNFLKYAGFTAAIIAAAAICAVSCSADRNRTKLSHTGIFAMDTYCDIKVTGADSSVVSNVIYTLEKELDSFNPESTVSILNSGGTALQSSEAGDVITRCLTLQEAFPGGVDITAGRLTSLWDITGENPHVPEEWEITEALDTIGSEKIFNLNGNISLAEGTALDLGAVAKGYVLDKVQQKLLETKAQCAVVSTTSSMLLYGSKPDGTDFEITVRGAKDGEILGTALVGSCFLSTSGGYERYFRDDNGKTYSHILDTKTGYPVETDLATVTVFCNSGIMSDYLSTLIYMEGTANISRHLQSEEYELVAADIDGNIYVSPGLHFIYETEENT